MAPARVRTSDRAVAVTFWLLAVAAFTVPGMWRGLFGTAGLALGVAGVAAWFLLHQRLPFASMHALQVAVVCGFAPLIVPLVGEAAFQAWRLFLPLEAMLEAPWLPWVRITVGFSSLLLLVPLVGVGMAALGRPFVPGLGALLRRHLEP